MNPVWIDAGPKSNGLMSLLDRDAPMIGLQVDGLFEAPLNLQRLDAALAASRGRTACAIAFENDAGEVETTLAWFGFPVRRRTPLAFPFFSRQRLIDLVVFEVALPPPLGMAPVEGVATPWAVDPLLYGSMDGPVEGQQGQGTLLVRGWAREPGEDLLVRVLVGGVEVEPASFRRVPRPDVAAALPQMGDCSSPTTRCRTRWRRSMRWAHPRWPRCSTHAATACSSTSRSRTRRLIPTTTRRWQSSPR